jgi:hypothetical protein
MLAMLAASEANLGVHYKLMLGGFFGFMGHKGITLVIEKVGVERIIKK